MPKYAMNYITSTFLDSFSHCNVVNGFQLCFAHFAPFPIDVRALPARIFHEVVFFHLKQVSWNYAWKKIIMEYYRNCQARFGYHGALTTVI